MGAEQLTTFWTNHFRNNLHAPTANECRPHTFWFVGLGARAKARYNFHKDSMPAWPNWTISYGLGAEPSASRLIYFQRRWMWQIFMFSVWMWRLNTTPVLSHRHQRVHDCKVCFFNPLYQCVESFLSHEKNRNQTVFPLTSVCIIAGCVFFLCAVKLHCCPRITNK